MCNRHAFQCKFCKQCMKYKNIISYHMMMKLHPNYKGKQLLKMYPTWTKNKTKEIFKLGEKYGKDTPCKNKRRNFDDVVLPNKRATSGKQIGVEGAMPPPRAITPWHKKVFNLSGVSDDDFILSPQNKKNKNIYISNLSLSKRNTFAQITTEKKITIHVRHKRFATTIVPTSQPFTTLSQHSTITTLWQSIIVGSKVIVEAKAHAHYNNFQSKVVVWIASTSNNCRNYWTICFAFENLHCYEQETFGRTRGMHVTPHENGNKRHFMQWSCCYIWGMVPISSCKYFPNIFF